MSCVDSPASLHYQPLAYKPLVLRSSSNRDTMLNSTFIILNFYRTIDRMVLLTKWSRLLCWVQLVSGFVGYLAEYVFYWLLLVTTRSVSYQVSKQAWNIFSPNTIHSIHWRPQYNFLTSVVLLHIFRVPSKCFKLHLE